MILELLIAAMSPTAPDDVESLVSSLGPHSDYRSVEEIGRHGCRALPALVRQLEIVPADRVPRHDQELYPREMRVVWSIAALRHITNTDFHAPRPSSFDPESHGGQALSLGAPPDSTKFFGIWMSRGIHYFAPAAQQRTILAQWRRFDASGACRRARPNPDVAFWLNGLRYNDPSFRLANAATRLTPPRRSLQGVVRIGGSIGESKPDPAD